MFQVLNKQCLLNVYSGYQTFLLPICQSGPAVTLTPEPGGSTPLFCPAIRLCATEQGTVFKVLSL